MPTLIQRFAREVSLGVHNYGTDRKFVDHWSK